MNFYVLYNPRFLETQFAYGEDKGDIKTGEAKVCPGCGNFISMLEWLPPYEINVSKKKLGDFIFGTYVGPVLSERVKERYEHSDLSGLSNFRKVKLYRGEKLLSEEYYYPEVSLVNSFIDLDLVEFEESGPCDTCQKGTGILTKIDGISFLNPNRIGQDIFFTTAIGQGTIIVSENMKILIEKNGFTNAKLIEAYHYKWDSLNPIRY